MGGGGSTWRQEGDRVDNCTRSPAIIPAVSIYPPPTAEIFNNVLKIQPHTSTQDLKQIKIFLKNQIFTCFAGALNWFIYMRIARRNITWV